MKYSLWCTVGLAVVLLWGGVAQAEDINLNTSPLCYDEYFRLTTNCPPQEKLLPQQAARIPNLGTTCYRDTVGLWCLASDGWVKVTEEEPKNRCRVAEIVEVMQALIADQHPSAAEARDALLLRARALVKACGGSNEME